MQWTLREAGTLELASTCRCLSWECTGVSSEFVGTWEKLKFAVLESKAGEKSLPCRTPVGRRVILYFGLSHPADQE